MGCGLRRNATEQYTSSGSLRAKAVECRACFVFAFDAARWPIHAPSRALLWKTHAGRLVALKAFELLLELVERHQEVDKPLLLGLDDLHRGARADAVEYSREVLAEVRPVGTAAMHLDVIHRGGE